MYKTFASLITVATLGVFGIFSMYQNMPTPVQTAVIAEKTSGGKLGGQAAVLLPNDLSSDQHIILNTAYKQAQLDGHKNPELVQGVLLQESKAGAANNFKVAGSAASPYYGLGQIKIEAAKDVMKRWPELWSKYKFQTKTDDELRANLILNNPFNIEVTSKYLKLLSQLYGFTGRDLMNAYNRGPAGVQAVGQDWHYALGVEANIASLKKTRQTQ